MTPGTASTNLDYQLPADAYYHLVRTLCLALPPPPGDSPDDRARRDHAAIARIAGLVPSNAAEADVAAQYVAASEQWKVYLRLAQAPETTPECAATCSGRAHGMMRQSNSALRLLLRMQEVRARREADNAGCTRADCTERCAIALMVEALAAMPEPIPEPEPKPSEANPGSSPAEAGAAPATPDLIRGEDMAIAEPPPSPPGPEPKPEPAWDPEPLTEAEHYAALYPERAALIRRLGRVPDDASFGPPDEDLVQALVTARSPALAALDLEFAQPRGSFLTTRSSVSRSAK